MAQEPNPIKLFQIEEPGGNLEAKDGFGMAVAIELSHARGASVAAAIGGNAELIVRPEVGGGIAGNLNEARLTNLLRDLRSLAEKVIARPVTHAVVRLDGFDLTDHAVLSAAARAELALLGIKRDGDILDAAVEAEDLAAILSD